MEEKKINLENILFYLSYFLFMLYAFFGMIEVLREPLKLLTNISMGIILFVLIFQLKKYKLNEFIRTILLLGISFIFIFVSGNRLFLKLTLIILISKNISFEKKISFDVKLRVLFLIIMIILYNLGIAEDIIAYYNNKIRHSIGFSNPNVLGLHTFILCMELLYMSRKGLSLGKITIYTAIMLFSNLYSGSRTALLLYVLAAILFYIYKIRRDFFYNEIIKKAIIYSPIITSLLIIIFYVLYIKNMALGFWVDKLTSGRLLNMRYFLSNYKLNLLGTDISVANKSCDTAIVYVLLSFGYFGAFLYIFGFKRLLKILYKKDLIEIAIIVFIFMVYGISEKLWLFADCNILITSVGFLIYNYEGVKQIGKQSNKYYNTNIQFRENT